MIKTKVTEYPKIETSEQYAKAVALATELGSIVKMTNKQRKKRAELLLGVYVYKRANGLLGLVSDES